MSEGQHEGDSESVGSLSEIGQQGDPSQVGASGSLGDRLEPEQEGEGSGTSEQDGAAAGAAAVPTAEEWARFQQEHANLETAYGQQSNEIGQLRQQTYGPQAQQGQQPGYAPQYQQPGAGQQPGWGQPTGQPGVVGYGQPQQGMPGQPQLPPELQAGLDSWVQTGDARQFLGALNNTVSQEVRNEATRIVQGQAQARATEQQFLTNNPAFADPQPRQMLQMALSHVRMNFPGMPYQQQLDMAGNQAEQALLAVGYEYEEGAAGARQTAQQVPGTAPRGARAAAAPAGPTSPEQLIKDMTQFGAKQHAKRQEQLRRPRRSS